LTGASFKRAKEEQDMADEETRKDEPDVEGHGLKSGTKDDMAEGTSAGAHGDEDSDDVEAHVLKDGVKDGFKDGIKDAKTDA
jgi:hypothetical protein